MGEEEAEADDAGDAGFRAARMAEQAAVADRLVLFESRLSPQGAQFIPVLKAPLGGAVTGEK